MSPAESAPSTVAGRKRWPLLGHCGSSPRRLPAPRSVPPGRRCCLWPVPHWSLPAAAVETVLPGGRASGPVPFSRRSAALQPYLINRSVNSIEAELNAFFFFSRTRLGHDLRTIPADSPSSPSPAKSSGDGDTEAETQPLAGGLGDPSGVLALETLPRGGYGAHGSETGGDEGVGGGHSRCGRGRGLAQV